MYEDIIYSHIYVYECCNQLRDSWIRRHKQKKKLFSSPFGMDVNCMADTAVMVNKYSLISHFFGTLSVVCVPRSHKISGRSWRCRHFVAVHFDDDGDTATHHCDYTTSVIYSIPMMAPWLYVIYQHQTQMINREIMLCWCVQARAFEWFTQKRKNPNEYKWAMLVIHRNFQHKFNFQCWFDDCMIIIIPLHLQKQLLYAVEILVQILAIRDVIWIHVTFQWSIWNFVLRRTAHASAAAAWFKTFWNGVAHVFS